MDLITYKSLPASDQIRLKNSSKVADSLEIYWARKISGHLEDLTPIVLESLRHTGRVPQINLDDLFIEHFFDVSTKAMRYAMTEVEERGKVKKVVKAAKFPVARIPKSLEGLMKLYDLWRKGKYKPKRAVKQAKAIKDLYLKKVRSVWEEHSEDFRKGNVATQELVVQEIKEAANTTISRAKNIVRTESTSYYNQARKEFYDESEDITHYLFLAIRDAATSPWCTPLTIRGYRGRSGLVYAKTDPLCDKERPACHPGCRSEYLPLNRLNPAHLKYIQNLSIQRRENTCFPLLKGWRS